LGISYSQHWILFNAGLGYLKPGFSTSFSFNDHVEIALSVMYTFIGETTDGAKFWYDTTGVSFKAIESGMTLKYKF
jgi:hypothetical protein